MWAGGWSDLETMKRSYQQPDDATVYRVVSEPVADLALDTGT